MYVCVGLMPVPAWLPTHSHVRLHRLRSRQSLAPKGPWRRLGRACPHTRLPHYVIISRRALCRYVWEGPSQSLMSVRASCLCEAFVCEPFVCVNLMSVRALCLCAPYVGVSLMSV